MVSIPQYGKTGVEDILANAGAGSAKVPAGTYIGVFDKAEMKTTSTNGQMLVLDFRITNGEHADTVLVERLNVVNSNDTAVKIAFETLARIAKAVGLDTLPSDTKSICGKLISVKVKDEQQKEWTDRDGNQRAGGVKSVIDSKTYAPMPKAATPMDSLPDWA